MASIESSETSSVPGLGAASTEEPQAVHWQHIDDYSSLSKKVRETRFANEGDFIKGPLKRYLELVDASSGRAAARIVEHLAASVHWYKNTEAAQSRRTSSLEEDIDEIVQRHFSSDNANDRYMLDVYLGRATHNYRASE